MVPCDRCLAAGRDPVGSPVPCSVYVRDYCIDCGEPIRVGSVGAYSDAPQRSNLTACATCGPCRPRPSLDALTNRQADARRRLSLDDRDA